MKKSAVLLSALCLALAAAGALAQEAYPTHPILLTHGNTPGSNSDLMARIIADPLAARLGQPVVVESRPGAGQTLAFGRIASGTPDGYTLIMMHSGHPIAGAMYKALKYDTVSDFQMLSQLILYPFVLAVRQDHPLKSMADLIAYAKANPGKLSFSSTGVGTTQHLTGVLLEVEGRHPDEPHLLSWCDPGRYRRPGRQGRRSDRNADANFAADLVRPDARPRGHHRESLAHTARHPAGGRHRAGLRGQRLDGRGNDP